MKYRLLTGTLLIFIAALIQGNLLGYIEIFSVRANLMIVLTVIIALLRSPFESGLMGALIGLVYDSMLGKTLGWYALLLMLLGVCIAFINEKLYREHPLVLVTFAFSSTVLVEVLFFFIIFLFRGFESFPMLFSTIILPEAVFNSVLILALFKPVSKVYNILDTLDRKRNRLSS